MEARVVSLYRLPLPRPCLQEEELGLLSSLPTELHKGRRKEIPSLVCCHGNQKYQPIPCHGNQHLFRLYLSLMTPWIYVCMYDWLFFFSFKGKMWGRVRSRYVCLYVPCWLHRSSQEEGGEDCGTHGLRGAKQWDQHRPLLLQHPRLVHDGHGAHQTTLLCC